MTPSRDDILLAQRYGAVYSEYYSVVKYFAQSLIKSEEDAEDIAQDVFAKLWTMPEMWADNKDIGTYIYAMTKNATLNFIKHRKIKQDYQEQCIEKSLIEEIFRSEDTLEALESIYYKEAVLMVRLALDRLPERRREIFIMSRFKKMSHNEIAEKLNISVRTVEHQIYRALLELKKTILIALFLVML